MKRYKYGINSQLVNFTNFSEMIPLTYVEVIPGDTISGNLQARFVSDVTNRPILNRAWVDVIACYVPFRLLNSNFPNMLMDEAGATVPTVSDSFPTNYENSSATHAAWQRYAYNFIYNEVMRHQDVGTVSLTNASRIPIRNKESVLNLRPKVSGRFDNQSVDVQAGTPDTVNVDDIRRAFAEDNFQKLRTYYGDRYVDYLRAVGVKVNWSIEDDPEILLSKSTDLQYKSATVTDAGSAGEVGGKWDSVVSIDLPKVNWSIEDDPEILLSKSTDLQYKSATVTDAGSAGEVGGKWDSVVSIDLPKVFCPEHGLIAVMAVPRLNWINRVHGYMPVSAKMSRADYWYPQQDSGDPVNWRQELFVGSGAGTDHYTPRYEDLRCGWNMVASPVGMDFTTAYWFDYANAAWLPTNVPSVADYASMFSGFLDPEVSYQFQVTTKQSFTRLSSLRPSHMRFDTPF